RVRRLPGIGREPQCLLRRVPQEIVGLVVVAQRRVAARRRRRAAHDPVAEVEPDRVDRLGVRDRIGGERALAVVGAGARGRRGRGYVETPIAPPRVGGPDGVTPDGGGQRGGGLCPSPP